MPNFRGLLPPPPGGWPPFSRDLPGGSLPSVRELEGLRDEIGQILSKVQSILAKMDQAERRVYGRMADNLETAETMLDGAREELDDAAYGRTLPGALSLTEAIEEVWGEEEKP